MSRGHKPATVRLQWRANKKYLHMFSWVSSLKQLFPHSGGKHVNKDRVSTVVVTSQARLFYALLRY